MHFELRYTCHESIEHDVISIDRWTEGQIREMGHTPVTTEKKKKISQGKRLELHDVDNLNLNYSTFRAFNRSTESSYKLGT